MKTSARNQFAGVIKQIRTGGQSDQVVLALPNMQEIIAVLPRETIVEWNLKIGDMAFALVKSTHIIIATDLANIKLSAHNQLQGMITHIERGAVHAVITLDLGSGIFINAGVTMHSTEQLDLHPGQYATAVFQAQNVVLGKLA